MSRKLDQMKNKYVDSIRKDIETEKEVNKEELDQMTRGKPDNDILNSIHDQFRSQNLQHSIENQAQNLQNTMQESEKNKHSIFSQDLDSFDDLEDSEDQIDEEILSLVSYYKDNDESDLDDDTYDKFMEIVEDDIMLMSDSEIEEIQKMEFPEYLKKYHPIETEFSNLETDTQFEENTFEELIEELSDNTESLESKDFSDEDSDPELMSVSPEIIAEEELTPEEIQAQNLDLLKEQKQLDRETDYTIDAHKINFHKQELPKYALGFDFQPWLERICPYNFRSEGEQALRQLMFGILSSNEYYLSFVEEMNRSNPDPKQLLLINLANKFQNLTPTSRELDFSVLKQFDLENSYLPGYFAEVFQDYQKALVSGDIDVLPMNDNFHLDSKAKLKVLDNKGLRYQFKDGVDFESNVPVSLKFLEVLHFVGVRALRRLNTEKKYTVIFRNEYERGLLGYTMEKGLDTR